MKGCTRRLQSIQGPDNLKYSPKYIDSPQLQKQQNREDTKPQAKRRSWPKKKDRMRKNDNDKLIH